MKTKIITLTLALCVLLCFAGLTVSAYSISSVYTITFFDEDGETKLAEITVNENDVPVYPGAAPTKKADTQYTYVFSG